MSRKTILEVKNLTKYFPVIERWIIRRKTVGYVHACDGVSFTIQKGETVGLVGESGCGKTTLARTILYLIEPDSGEVYFEEENINEIFKSKNRQKILELRSKMQIIFQNPLSSLNPRHIVSTIISEPMIMNKQIPKEERIERVQKLLKLVGLEDYHVNRYPHEFSGGQRQRISIARTLALEPKFIILDEPVSSLDISIRSQILNVLMELREKEHLTYLYVSHDLSTVRHICDRVMVMYLGKILEVANVDELFNNPRNPYSQALLSAILYPDPDARSERIILREEPSSPINPPLGCRFYSRCPYAMSICKEKEPKLVDVGKGHFCACHRV